MRGEITSLFLDRGFGFVRVETQEKDVFFHLSGLKEGLNFGDLKSGDVVEFEIEQGEKGPKAINMTLANNIGG